MGFAPVQQHLDHGRGQQDLVDFFLVDGLQHTLRCEGLQDRVGATGDEQPGDRGEVGQVEHRHRMQEHRA
ncbi:hypothetical protein D3C86_487920 [compost metagenome]